MRLDKLLSHALGWTRSSTVKAMRHAVVTVNGVPVRDTSTAVDPERDAIVFDGEPVHYLRRVILMMHKPAGVVCATEDPSERTVFDALDERHHRHDLKIVGRLDKFATGLLVLTTDGDLVHRLTHPRRETEKTYLVTYDGALLDPVARFASGIALEDGTVCRPAHFAAESPGLARVTLHEGKYHQVRRMIAACGGHVTALHRVAVGPLTLDAALAPGEARPLTADEIAQLDQP